VFFRAIIADSVAGIAAEYDLATGVKNSTVRNTSEFNWF
jgi:hypothetical protein